MVVKISLLVLNVYLYNTFIFVGNVPVSAQNLGLHVTGDGYNLGKELLYQRDKSSSSFVPKDTSASRNFGDSSFFKKLRPSKTIPAQTSYNIRSNFNPPAGPPPYASSFVPPVEHPPIDISTFYSSNLAPLSRPPPIISSNYDTFYFLTPLDLPSFKPSYFYRSNFAPPSDPLPINPSSYDTSSFLLPVKNPPIEIGNSYPSLFVYAFNTRHLIPSTFDETVFDPPEDHW